MTDAGSRPLTGQQETPEEKAATTSLGDLLTGVSKDISTLFRQEVELAKAELTESAKKAGKGAGMFGGAGLTALFALLFLSIAAWWGLGFLLNNALSAVVIAVIYGIVALILFLRGKKELKDINGAPKTVDSLKKIPETMKPGGNS
jgi:Flp pilus assembly protein TadB